MINKRQKRNREITKELLQLNLIITVINFVIVLTKEFYFISSSKLFLSIVIIQSLITALLIAICETVKIEY